MKRQCLLDLDGVLLDFVYAAHRWYGLPYSYENYPYEKNAWDILPNEKFTGMSTAQFWNGLREEFWATVPWMSDGRKILAAVEEEFGKENISILTTPTLSHECSAGKHRWINKNLPSYNRRFLIGPAKHFCAGPNRILVDDANHNVDAYRKQGGKAILVPRKWNRRCNKADDALKIVRKELKECRT